MMFTPRMLVCSVLSLFCLETTIFAGSAATRTADPAESGGPTRALGFYKPGQPVPLEEGFRDPPAISRVQCWWQPPGSPFTKDEITRELEEFKAKGMGGVTIKDTDEMPRDEHTAHIKDIPFMSEQWLDMFAHIVAECGRLGLICRSRSSSGWNEGGPWIPPEMSIKTLVFAKSQPLQGPTTYSGPIPREVPEARKAVARAETPQVPSPTTEQFKSGRGLCARRVRGRPARGRSDRESVGDRHARVECPERPMESAVVLRQAHRQKA